MRLITVVMLLCHIVSSTPDDDTGIWDHDEWFRNLEEKWKAEEKAKLTSTTTEVYTKLNYTTPDPLYFFRDTGEYVFDESLNRYVPINETVNKTDLTMKDTNGVSNSLKDGGKDGVLKIDKNTRVNADLDENTGSNAIQTVDHNENEENHAQCSHNYCITIILLVSIANYYHNVSKFSM